MDRSEDAAVSGACRRGASRARRDHDRNELACRPFGSDLNRELERDVSRFLLIGHHGAIDGAWHTDDPGEVSAVL